MNITTEERDYLIHAPKMILKKPRKLFQNVNPELFNRQRINTVEPLP